MLNKPPIIATAAIARGYLNPGVLPSYRKALSVSRKPPGIHFRISGITSQEFITLRQPFLGVAKPCSCSSLFVQCIFSTRTQAMALTSLFVNAFKGKRWIGSDFRYARCWLVKRLRDMIDLPHWLPLSYLHLNQGFFRRVSSSISKLLHLDVSFLASWHLKTFFKTTLCQLCRSRFFFVRPLPLRTSHFLA